VVGQHDNSVIHIRDEEASTSQQPLMIIEEKPQLKNPKVTKVRNRLEI
jgi:hypothetical protein